MFMCWSFVLSATSLGTGYTCAFFGLCVFCTLGRCVLVGVLAHWVCLKGDWGLVICVFVLVVNLGGC